MEWVEAPESAPSLRFSEVSPPAHNADAVAIMLSCSDQCVSARSPRCVSVVVQLLTSGGRGLRTRWPYSTGVPPVYLRQVKETFIMHDTSIYLYVQVHVC